MSTSKIWALESEMATQTGYKASELGMIPQDWDVVELGSVAEIQRGASPRPIDSPIWFSQSSNVGWLRISDVTKSEKYLYNTIQNLSEEGIKNSRYVAKDSLIMSICATVGKPIINRKDICIHDGFVVFRNPQFDIEFMFYVLQEYESKWGNQGQTGSQMNLNTDLIKNKIVCLPPLSEQTAIATALSDTDALISSLQTLIAKKKAIKLSAMQNLLSGKIRLPEFAQRPDGSPKTTRQTELGCVPEDWEVVELGKRFETFSGGTPSTSIKGYYGGDIKWITSSDLNKGIIYDVENTITELGFQNSSAKKVKKDTLLLALYGATAGVVGITKIDATINQAVLAIIPKRDSSLFLYYWLSFNKNKIIETYAQGGQANLSGDIVRAFNIIIPKSITEQTAIAQLLSDMDAEIEALEGRLKKTQSLKQGMMQTLLTGKIRLPLE